MLRATGRPGVARIGRPAHQHRPPPLPAPARPARPLRAVGDDETADPTPSPPPAPAALPSPPPLVDAGVDDETAWLLSFLPFSRLSLDAAAWLAANAQRVTAGEGEPVLTAGSAPSIVVVRSGALTVDAPDGDTTDDGGGDSSTSQRRTYVAGPGAAFGAADVLARRPASLSLAAGPGPATVLVMDAALIDALAARCPGAERELLVGVADAGTVDAAAARAELAAAADRAAALQPYLVTAPKRGIVGRSKYADRLRRAIVAAARDPARRPAIVYGEPGLGKDNVAALIHYGSLDRRKPMVAVDCARVTPADLCGRGARRGLLAPLGDGTLLLNNVHLAPPAVVDVLVQLLASGEYTPAPSPRRAAGAGGLAPAPILKSPARFVMTAEAVVPRLDALSTVVRVPPLRVRPADIKPLAEFFLREYAREVGGAPAVLTAAALRQLEAHAFPDNVAELRAAIERAAAQSGAPIVTGGGRRKPGSGGTGPKTAPAGGRATAKTSATPSSSPAPSFAPITTLASYDVASTMDAATTQITSDALWFAAGDGDRGRANLLALFPPLRALLRSDFWWRDLTLYVVVPVYAAYVAFLFLGPQDRAHNFGLNLFWCWWWPGMFLIYPFVGRIWCMFCPFMAYGELVQRARTAAGVQLRKWPRDVTETYGPWFLYGLFYVILVWEQVWELSNHAALSAWLLLIITAGAMVGSFFYERRIWCRFLCPIGGMNGLFAKLAMTELRARKGVCTATCSTYGCIKGNPAPVPPDGLENPGCPVGSHPGNLVDNRHCVLCADCLKACPHTSVEVRLRPPAADILRTDTHDANAPELAMLFMLLGSVFVHRLPELSLQLGAGEPAWLAAPPTFLGPHAAVTALLLAAPGGLAWGVDAASRALARARLGPAAYRPPPPFVRLAYGWLPFTWAAILAHYEQWGLAEAGTVLRVAALGAHAPDWVVAAAPAGAAHPAVIAFLQGVTLLAGFGTGAGLTIRYAWRRPWYAFMPQVALMGVLTCELWTLIVG